MPSHFATALAQMDQDIDPHLGEDVAIIPMRDSDFDTAPDPERPAFDVVALVNNVDPSTADIAKLSARLPYEEFEIEILRDLIPPGMKLRKNDQTILLERDGSPRFKISRIDDAERGRLAFTVSRLAAE